MQKIIILSQALDLVFSHDLNVKAGMCDGTKTQDNANVLIDNVDSPHELAGSFLYNGRKCLFTPAVPHNLKLTRNSLVDLRVFVDDNNERIKWKYIRLMHKVQFDAGGLFSDSFL